jgi:hypothetical protein
VVQLKYFGDNRDFFKYDLITVILEHTSLSQYVFIPMLTAHRDDNEGMKRPRSRSEQSNDLFKFIMACTCNGKSLKHWETWFSPRVTSYKTVEPVDEILFFDDGRDGYWEKFSSLISEDNALIFVDPDIGLETGKPSYLRRMGREKYILNDELRFLVKQLNESSTLMFYQHLPSDKNKHVESVNKKLNQVRTAAGTVFTCAYREDDVAFLFISKNSNLNREIGSVLNRYYHENNRKHSSLHGL